MSSLRTPLPEAIEEAGAPSTQRARGTAPERATPADFASKPAETPGAAEPEEARASRSGRRGARRVSREDTLLSLPAPAERHEMEIVDRLEDVEQKLDDLTHRVRTLESAPRAAGAESASRPWLGWLIFLALLVAGWRLFRATH